MDSLLPMSPRPRVERTATELPTPSPPRPFRSAAIFPSASVVHPSATRILGCEMAKSVDHAAKHEVPALNREAGTSCKKTPDFSAYPLVAGELC